MGGTLTAPSEVPTLPTRETFADGILMSGRNVAFFEPALKEKLYFAVEECVENGLARNDVLEALEIDRLVYYHRVDAAVEEIIRAREANNGEADDKEMAPRRISKPEVRKMAIDEQLSLLERVQSDMLAGKTVGEACDRENISTAAFRYLEVNETDLKSKLALKKEEQQKEETKRAERERSRRKHISLEQQRVAVDAVELLRAGKLMSIKRGAELFDRSDQSIAKWKEKHQLSPLVNPNGSEKHARRPESEIVRIVYAIRAVNERKRRLIHGLLNPLNLRYQVYAKWQQRVEAIEEYLQQVQSSGVDIELHSDLICKKISNETGIRTTRVAKWLEGLFDVHQDTSIRQCIEVLLQSEEEDDLAPPQKGRKSSSKQRQKNGPLPEESTLDNDRLAEQAIDGNRDAIGHIWNRFERYLYGLALKMMGNHQDAEEVMQEVFILALRKIHTVREPKAMQGWLHTIVRNTCLNFRQRVRGKEVLVEKFFDDELPIGTAEDALLKSEENMLVHEGLDSLRDMDRRTLLMFYVDGMSLIEISEREDSPIGTIKRRLHVARKRLQVELEKRGVGNIPLREEELHDMAM